MTVSKGSLLPLLVIVLLLGGVLFANHQETVSTERQAKANAARAQKAAAERAKLPACRSEDSSVAPSATEQNSLELVALSHLTTVPAGTSVDVQFSSYDGHQAAGSVEYAGAYGMYNFDALQTGHSQGLSTSNGVTDGGWKLTAFEPCQKI